jgi:serine/threonine protein kinase
MGECLGRGGFGEVYRASMRSATGLETEVAVKILRRDVGPESQAVGRLRDEGAMLARLDHPVILRVHDFVVLDGRVALVTEFVDGDDLGVCFAGRDPMPPRALIEVASQVSAALDVAWRTPRAPGEGPLRLVHRDIKPSNVRVSRFGKIKLLDFGIARSDEVQRNARTQTDLLMGSPAYMAPERFVDPAARPEADVFALGCVLFEGLAGERLFHGVPFPMMTAMALQRERFDTYVSSRLGALPQDVDPELMALVVAMVSYEPGDRPTAAAMTVQAEQLADRLTGRTLSRWCQQRAWTSRTMADGPLEGQVLTEGTLASARAAEVAAGWHPPPATSTSVDDDPAAFSGPTLDADSLASARRPAPGVGRLLGSALLIGIAALGAVAVGGLVVGDQLGQWLQGAPAPDASDSDPAPIDEASVASQPDPVAEPDGVDVAVEPPPAQPAQPARSAPVAVRRAATAPPQDAGASPPPDAADPADPVDPPSAEAPTESPPDEAVAVDAPAAVDAAPAGPSASIRVEGGVRVLLEGPEGSFEAPGEVPYGTYRVTAWLDGENPTVVQEAATIAGDAVVRCSIRFSRCSVL